MWRSFVLGALLAACTTESGEVTGPYTGPVARYVIDSISIPSTAEEVTRYAGDLDGDSVADNRFGAITRELRSWGDDLTSAGPEMIASGAIRSYLEIQADDLDDDESVSIQYLGAQSDPAVGVGARIHDGNLVSNRTRSSLHLGRARVHLPIFLDSDASEVDLDGLELDLAPDGRGGFTGTVRGAIAHGHLEDTVYAGLVQMFAANPGVHKGLRELVEGPGAAGDGVLTRAEVLTNSLIASLLAPDLDLTGVGPAVSFGFGIHASRCPDGVCTVAPVRSRCHDRVRDGDESDVDCGGSCLRCAASQACIIGADCQSGACANGRCTPPSCTDGIENGFEGDVDCGGVCSQKCAAGQRCDDHLDCASDVCMATFRCQ